MDVQEAENVNVEIEEPRKVKISGVRGADKMEFEKEFVLFEDILKEVCIGKRWIEKEIFSLSSETILFFLFLISSL